MKDELISRKAILEKSVKVPGCISKMVSTYDIAEAPAVDAVEVVYGRWIRRHNETKCSKCQFIYYSNHDDYNYCPNCGAKMDLEEVPDHGKEKV